MPRSAASKPGRTDLRGKTVFALHPHQCAFNLAADAALPLPEGVTPQRAVLAANMETALNAVWDAAAGPADRIAVVGAGVVGALVELSVRQACRRRGDAGRHRSVARCRRKGAWASALRRRRRRRAIAMSSFTPAATRRGLAMAIDLAGNEASIVEMSWYGTGTVGLALGGAFHSRRLKLISSQVGQVAPSHRPRWTHKRQTRRRRLRCWPIRRSTRCSRRPSPSTTCRRNCRAS